ncbi:MULTISPECIES: DUF1257 domain-containing protein [Sporomusa]|jgi:hypothetical protein|uniref:DUF1257 domain-containing protein n=1 Tax=uncultured Sporomusa sp. TaxID=307249 RepID=A0A212LX10_9FIRM|nr:MULTISPECIES: DUF1257 domain-containing protein [Sporomusa]MCM0761385.1 DUF1257 domain-containing protein [Sporomusa sphaeroides DSM 2875]SCM82135.1 conserved hypothetical protein [uncultured Sporomusa sp.]HML32600.1 DUF1257 domain-containing protein [Sporomusa sphaeroides]
MSHFTQVATKIKNKEILLSALRELGYEVEENTLITGYRGQETPVDIAVRMQQGYDIGFVLGPDGTYSFVTDWFGVQGTNEQEFTTKVQQQYALTTVMEQVRRQGFNVVEQQRDAGGEIRLTVRRWV